ncbi:MAG TPA: hypothetical protein VLT79_05955 [Gemmatimonadales bacterium]|nr:hypothetical protein [Gemmatimonadales bacterium]
MTRRRVGGLAVGAPVVRHAMRQSFGWRRPGDKHLALYRRLAVMRA